VRDTRVPGALLQSSSSPPASRPWNPSLRHGEPMTEPQSRPPHGARRELELADHVFMDAQVINRRNDPRFRARDDLAAICSNRVWSEETNMLDELKKKKSSARWAVRLKLSR